MIKNSTIGNIGYLIVQIWREQKSLLILFTLYTCVIAFSPFISIYFPKFIIDELTGESRFNTLIFLLIFFFLLNSTFAYLTKYLNSVNLLNLTSFRLKFVTKHSQRCLTTNYENTENPNFLNIAETTMRVLSDSFAGIQGIINSFFIVCGSIISLGGYMVIISLVHPLILCYLFLNAILVYFLTLRVKRYEVSRQEDISEFDRKGNYVNRVMGDFSYGKEIRLFNLADWFSKLFHLYREKTLMIRKDIRNQYFKIELWDVPLFLFREGMVYVYLVYRVIMKGMGLGDFTLYLATIAGFSSLLGKIMSEMAHIRGQNDHVNDLKAFLKEDDQVSAVSKLPSAPHEIEFRNVSFAYPGSEKNIFTDLSLKLESGKRLAIVGTNGAGKTTLVKLLCGFFRPTKGEILLNGINIHNIPIKEYRKILSVVFQEVKIFAFSIAENICIGSEKEVDYRRLRECLKKSGLIEKVDSFKKGVHTELLKVINDEGVEFSGGENQKIALARALYKDGSMLILDEPTAALDPLAEERIYRQFDNFSHGKTALYISHRLASTRFCDNIAMFKEGKIVEYGTHEKLLKRKGEYHDMFITQAHYYQESRN